MNKRNIYTDVIINELQQGYIFNQAVSEDYLDSEVHGLIITPRCDIENEKVITYHYLPIVTIDDWLCNDYWFLLKQILVKTLHQVINQILDSNGESKNLINYFKLDDILEKISPKIKNNKQKEKFKENIHWLKKIKPIDGRKITKDLLLEIHKVKSFKSIGSNILKDLTNNKRKEFYLIEDFENRKNIYHVVLLREIQKISLELGKKIAIGVNNSDLTEECFLDNDIKNIDDGFIAPIKVIKSPFIEHLVQNFFTNFGRIGITDHNINLREVIINKHLE